MTSTLTPPARPATAAPPLCQVAFSIPSPRSMDSYRDVLGLAPAGVRWLEGEQVARLQALPDFRAEMRWLLDRNAYFEVEFFRYSKPTPRALPSDWGPRDIGYTGIGVHVADFDATLERAAAAGSSPIAAIVGPGGRRRGWVRDPDGVRVEIMEDDPLGPAAPPPGRPEVPAAIRSVTATVGSVQRSLRFFEDTIGLTRGDPPLHGPDHAELLGRASDLREVVTLWAGPMAIELVEYVSPRPRRRNGRSHHCDHGVVHVAFGVTAASDYERIVARVREAGYEANEMQFEGSRCAYILDDQEFTVELLNTHEITGYPASDDNSPTA